ncbi:MAG: hypothetical protein JWO03_1789 [Bacteroidetes bacterium]|nr:hypothetical protein [Bacteroidota bacterium]
MEEMEVPTEHLHEHIEKEAEHSRDIWSTLTAVSTAFMAVFAALASLFAGHHSNEAVICQIKASDQWAYYQAKGIKKSIAELGATVTADIDKGAQKARIDKYETEQEGIQEKAKEFETESQTHLGHHVILAQCVTLFQIAIAISAISLLTRKRYLWIFALALSAVGLFDFVKGLL